MKRKSFNLKIKFLIITFAILIAILFKLPLKAFSYNYDDDLNPTRSPYSYNIAKNIDIQTLLPEELQKEMFEFSSIAKSKEEVFLVGRFRNNRNGIIIVLDDLFRVKKVLTNSEELPIPASPSSVCYTSGKLYVGSGADDELFVENFYEPNGTLIAKELDPVTQEIKEKIDSIINSLDKQEASAYKYKFESAIRKERKIYIYDRYDVDDNLLPDSKVLKYDTKFGLKTQEALILEYPFRPLNIASHDKSSNLFVVSESSKLGLLVFKKDGTFVKFIGSNKIEISKIDKIWRKFIKDSVLDDKDKAIQNNFSSIAVDESGFIYTATETSKHNQIQKFNAKGKNILLQDSKRPVIGDYTKTGEIAERSVFKYIDVSDFGTYIAFCRSKNRIFSYNNTGELLFIQGEVGESKEQFQNVKDMKFFNNDILILENINHISRLKVLKETPYGKLLNEASLNYHLGKFNESAEIYDNIISLNSNSDFAYVGRGKIYMIEKNFSKACECFKIANHAEFYTQAYEKYRNQKIVELFPLFLSIIALIISVTVTMKVSFKKKKQ